MEFDFTDVMPNVTNWLIVGLLAATFIVFAKWLSNRYDLGPVKDFFNAI